MLSLFRRRSVSLQARELAVLMSDQNKLGRPQYGQMQHAWGSASTRDPSTTPDLL